MIYKVYGIGEDKQGVRYFTGPNREGATKGKYFQGVPAKIVDNLDATTKTQPIENFYNFADAFGNCRHEGGVDFRSGKKPTAFLRSLLKLGLSEEDDDIVLDFFGGSSSTAHAIFQINKEEQRNCKFIVVQIPEKVEDSEYENIAEIGKERIRRVIKQLNQETKGQKALNGMCNTPEDLGFKVFRQERSVFKPWQGKGTETIEQLELRLGEQVTPLREGWTRETLLAEILLQEGFPLDSAIEPCDDYAHNDVSVVSSPACAHRLYICFDDKLKHTTVRALDLQSEDVFVCLDSAFADDNDKIRLNSECRLRTI